MYPLGREPLQQQPTKQQHSTAAQYAWLMRMMNICPASISIRSSTGARAVYISIEVSNCLSCTRCRNAQLGSVFDDSWAGKLRRAREVKAGKGYGMTTQRPGTMHLLCAPASPMHCFICVACSQYVRMGSSFMVSRGHIQRVYVHRNIACTGR